MSSASPFTPEEQQRLRAQIPALAQINYLNAGTLGPLPQPAIDALDDVQRYDELQRQDAKHWERLVELQQEARAAMGLLTGVAPEQVALMHSTHEGLNTCLWGMELEAGDGIVTTDEEHPGLLVPLRHVQQRLGAVVSCAPWLDDDQAFVDGVLALVDERTRAIALSHVSWVTGRVAPLRLLREALPAGVRIIVDGAQSAGALVVDPSDGWDAYTVSGQKWPCGPNGSGGLALLDPTAWAPTFGAYMQVTSWDDCLSADIVDDGRRLETSQEALPPLAGFAASTRWIVEEVGLARVHAHARACNERARAALLAGGIEAASLHGHDHLLCIDVPDARAMAIANELYELGILTRPLGEHRLRVSFGFWATFDEVDACIAALLPLLW